jgi:uncharacterized protein (TIGR02246 family)
MRTKMPDVIDAYIQASNSRDADRFGSLFSEDAIVHDEGQEYRGVVAIRKWLASTVKKYAFTLTPIDLSLEKNETVLSVKIEGDFLAVPYRRVFASFFVKGKSRDWISLPEK